MKKETRRKMNVTHDDLPTRFSSLSAELDSADMIANQLGKRLRKVC